MSNDVDVTAKARSNPDSLLPLASGFLFRLSPQYPRGSDGELPGIPEDDAIATERDGPRPAQAPAHVRQSLQTGQEGT